MSTDLDQQLRAALQARRGDWQEIAKSADVSYSWLSKFVNGHIPNPGYETLKKLHAALFPVVAEPTTPEPTGA